MRLSRSVRVAAVVSASLVGACSGAAGTQSGGDSADGSVTRDGAAGAMDRATPAPDARVTDAGAPSFDIPTTPRDVAPAEDGGEVVGCGPRERCNNGVDDDCNGRVDEDCACVPGATQRCYPGDPSRAGRGVCTMGTQRCEGTGEFGDWSACTGHGEPRPFACGANADNDCDGATDPACACMPGQTRSCYTGPMGTSGRGLCRAGTQSCAMTAGGAAWGPCMGQVLPGVDQCDGMDRDCDGNPNTGCGCMLNAARSCYTGAAGTAGRGACRNGTQRCVMNTAGTQTVWGACAGEVTPSRDQCDGVDRDCDGNPNTGCVCTRGAARECFSGPASTRNVGICRAGLQNCVAAPAGSATLTAWGPCMGEVLARPAEVCGNMADDNCNGATDEGCAPGCATGTVRCGDRCVDVQSDVANCGSCGNACPPSYACVMGVCVGSGRLRFTLTWDRAGDMDLAVVPPCGTEISYRNTMACGGTLDHDDIPGTGPENVFWDSSPPTGTYLVCATPFGVSGATNFTLTVVTGTTTRQTWTGNRASRSGYVRCDRSSPYFVGAFTL